VACSFIDAATYLAMVSGNGWIHQDDQKKGVWIGWRYSYLAKYNFVYQNHNIHVHEMLSWKQRSAVGLKRYRFGAPAR
jgi:hypothetical protein